MSRLEAGVWRSLVSGRNGEGRQIFGRAQCDGGKVDPEHKGCAYMAVVDELCQEAKICLHEVKARGHRHTGINWPLFDYLFKANGQLKWFIKDQTAVFYVKVSDLRRRDINHRIASDLMRPNLSCCEKEMSSVNWVRFSRREQVWKSPEGIIAPPSRYLQALISKVYEANDIRSDATDFSFNVHRISDHVRKV